MANRDREREQMEKFNDEEMLKGSDWCLLDSKWWQMWKSFARYGSESKENGEGVRPGPIDNSQLLEGDDRLKKGLRENYDYVLLPANAYALFVEWYGGGPTIARKAIQRTPTSGTQVELYPLIFEISTPNNEGEPDQLSKVVMKFNTTDSMNDVIARVAAHFNYNVVRSRLWVRYEEGEWVSLTASDRNMEYVVEVVDQVLPMMIEQQHETTDEWPRDVALNAWRYLVKVGDLLDSCDSENKWYESVITSLSTPEGQHTKETVAGVHFRGWSEKWDTTYPLFSNNILKLHTKVSNWRDFRMNDSVEAKKGSGAKDKWFEAKIVQVDTEGQRVQIRYTGLKEEDQWLPIQSEQLCEVGTHTKKKKEAPRYSYATQTSYSSYDSYRSNIRGHPPIRGAVGLQNLGNTCFMNSMLQCLSNTQVLTDYLVSDRFRPEVNINNPLGMGGRVVESYAALMKEMWSGDFSCVVPSQFKNTIGQYAPQFAGYQQQDSQELMSFLLDGLHEDLNRVRNKPYTESVEDGGRPDAVVAKESWDRHLLRNDSVIVDRFQGQLRSHVTCPTCNHSSITFDPYMSLSLPLPSTNERAIKVMMARRAAPWPPVQISARVSKMGSFGDLRRAIATEAGVAAADLRIADIYNGRVFRWLDDDRKSVMDIRDVDVLFAYEVMGGPPVGAVGEEAEEPLYIHLVHSRDQVLNNSRRSDLFLAPLLLSIPASWSCNRLRSYIWERMTYVLAEGHQFTESAPPYRIRLTGAQGLSCGRCTVSSGCRGCELPADGSRAAHQLVERGCLTLDWGVCESGAAPSSTTSTTSTGYSYASYNPVPMLPPAGMDADKERDLTNSARYGSSRGEEESGPDGVVQLSACFEKFVEREQLGEEDPWYCPRCKELKRAIKKFDLWSVPEILIVHLKRFQYAQGTYFVHRDKINSLVDFPIQGLDLTNHLLSKTGPAPIYDLYGVSEHSGGLGGGHYTAIAQNFEDGNWYSFNDSSVSRTDASRCITRQAYVLFYKRRGTRRATGNALATN